MNENEIHAGKDYIIKVGHNEVKVKVLSHTGHSWIVKTAGGKIMPIQMADRFVRQVALTGEVPLQTPATPAEADATETSTSPTVPVTVATEVAMPEPPATVPPPAIPPTEAATPATIPVATTEKKLSMLDAAAKVLEAATAPMTVKEIIAAMEESGLWKPGNGLTPANSLVAAVGQEIKKKPSPRFRKTAPGKFEYAGGERHE